MKLKILAMLVVASAGSLSAQELILTPQQRAEGELMVAEAGAKLADTLRDTTDAKFRRVFLQKTVGTDGKEHVSLCGEVNSRNGYGGMSGFHSFMLIAGQVRVGGAGQIINADEICNNGRAKIDGRDYTAELRAAFDKNAGG